MKTLDLKKFLKCIRKIDDTGLTSFLNETGIAKEPDEVGSADVFKKFTSFMTADKPEEVAESISLEDLGKMACSVSEFGDLLAGNASISYNTVWDRLNKMKSVGRRLL